ncbi:MAG: hypothetical protein P0111_08100 [Nitrospira sp.]|nr:hypothetical protein [Nitrospira sp.]
MALVVSLLSVRLGGPVALFEICVGIAAGNLGNLMDPHATTWIDLLAGGCLSRRKERS